MRGTPKRRVLEIRPNAAGQFTLSVTDLNGAPISLSAYGFRAMIRGAYSDLNPVVSLTTGHGIAVTSPSNVFQVTWTAAQANAIVAAMGRGVWDLYFDPAGVPDATSYLALTGEVAVRNTATR